MAKNKLPSPWKPLLLIPLQLVTDGAVLLAALLISDANLGLTPAAIALVALMTAWTTTKAIHRAAAAGNRRRLLKNAGEDAPPLPPVGLTLWQCWLPLPLQMGVYGGIVFGVGSYEINRFYADPTHVGFAIPIVSLLLAALFLLMLVVVFVLCLHCAVKTGRGTTQQG